MQDSKPWQKKGTLEKIVNSTIDLGTVGFAVTQYLTSTLLTYAGFFTADMITKKKKGEKLTAKTVTKSLWDNAVHASQNGFAQEELYDKLSLIPGNTVAQKIGRSAGFTGFMATGYQAFYQAQQYIRDEIGWSRAIASLAQPKKLKMYAKDFYETRLKGKFWKRAKKTFKGVVLQHQVANNLTNSMPVKMGIAASNDVVFSLVNKPEKGFAKVPYAQTEYKKPETEYESNYQPYKQAA